MAQLGYSWKRLLVLLIRHPAVNRGAAPVGKPHMDIMTMRSGIDKKQVVRRIIEQLTANLSMLEQAAKLAHDVATDEENRADNKYDTLSLEASYLGRVWLTCGKFRLAQNTV